MNAIPFDVVQNLWVPEMSLPNALQAEGTGVDKGAQLMILKDGKRMPDDLSIARNSLNMISYLFPIFLLLNPHNKIFYFPY